MKVLFYLPKAAINEATEYYSKLMIKAFDDFDVIISESNIVSSAIDIIITIRPGDQNKLKYVDQNKKYTYINWFQGIGPEEYELLHKYTLKAKLGRHFLSYFEQKVLKRTNICIFVSKEMRRFYEKKYNLDLEKKSVIIPCYNKYLDQESFLLPDKYNKLSFVYAGALYDWQCIEETVLVFKMIYEIDPSAHLTLLTAQKQEAEELIKKFALVNIKILFVKLENLQNELAKYKYGFLLRKNDPINNVATPTKMNSYLAAGIIPIYTNVITDFEENIYISEYSLKFRLENDTINEIAKKIILFNKKHIEIDKIKTVYENVFLNYYRDDYYISLLESKVKLLFKRK